MLYVVLFKQRIKFINNFQLVNKNNILATFSEPCTVTRMNWPVISCIACRMFVFDVTVISLLLCPVNKKQKKWKRHWRGRSYETRWKCGSLIETLTWRKMLKVTKKNEPELKMCITRSRNSNKNDESHMRKQNVLPLWSWLEQLLYARQDACLCHSNLDSFIRPVPEPRASSLPSLGHQDLYSFVLHWNRHTSELCKILVQYNRISSK